MITLTQIKNIVSDIKSDDEWVNDSHSGAEYKGVKSGLDMLVKHLEELEKNKADDKETYVNEAMNMLEDVGYYIQNLWHVSDVQKNLSVLSDDEALGVLDEVLTSDEIFESIYDKMNRVIEEQFGEAGKDYL